MNFILALFSLFFLPVLSLKKIAPKLCINCKYFTTDRFSSNDKFGRCILFQREQINNYRLVNGITESNSDDYYYCSTARSYKLMCGQEGKLYKKKYKRKTISDEKTQKT